jgi:hypothetical protein
LAIWWRPGEMLMGPIEFVSLPDDEPTPCYSGRQIEEISIELPAGKRVRELPNGKEITNKYIQYKSQWSVAGRTLTLRREFSSVVADPVCIGEARLLAASALNEIREDYNATVTLIDK